MLIVAPQLLLYLATAPEEKASPCHQRLCLSNVHAFTT